MMTTTTRPDAEQLELVRHARAGHQAAAAALYHNLNRLAHQLADRVNLSASSLNTHEDLVHCAITRVLLKLHRYDQEKAWFGYWASTVMSREMWQMAQPKLTVPYVELPTAFDKTPAPPVRGTDLDAVPDDWIERAERSLTSREKDYVRRYFGIGCPPETMKAIGERDGRSRQRSHLILSRALDKMRARLQRYAEDFA